MTREFNIFKSVNELFLNNEDLIVVTVIVAVVQ